MTKISILLLLLLCIVTPAFAGGQSSLLNLWASKHYKESAFPAAWRPAKIPETETDLEAFQRYTSPPEGLSISNFVERFGQPSRYLQTSKSETPDFLIYDLPSGHTVALYVNKPPRKNFLACVIIAPDGSLVTLIK